MLQLLYECHYLTAQVTRAITHWQALSFALWLYCMLYSMLLDFRVGFLQKFVATYMAPLN